MTPNSWIRKLFARSVCSPIRRQAPRTRLRVEALEDRWVPATFTVLNTLDTGAGSLRQAVADANANIGADTIVFGDGSGAGGVNFLDGIPDTITLTSGAITFAGDTNLTTVTGTGAALLSVSGGNTQQVFWLNASTAASISGITVTAGNTASNGGGIFSLGALTLTDCTVSNNTAATNGGGVFSSGTLTMTTCTVSGNTATSNKGGGVYVPSGTATLNGVALISNHAGYRGGGFGNQNGTASLTNCTVSGNTLNSGSASGGGGVFNRNGTTTLTNTTVAGNVSTGGFKAAGVFNVAGTVTLTNCTVSGNVGQSATNGVGVLNQSATPISFRNTVVAGTIGDRDVGGAISSLGNNLVGNDATTTGWVASDLTGTSVTPLNPQLAPLADNGGPTWTMALFPSSPAINAGNSTGAPATDQRGQTRFGNTDIGAYEYQFKVTNNADIGLGSLRNAIATANAVAGTDTIVFKIGSGAATIAPNSALPTINRTVVIDGTTQPGYAGTPIIEINYQNAGNAYGIVVNTAAASNTIIQGLVVNRVQLSGVLVTNGATGVLIQNNYIGTDVTGTIALGNGGDGVDINQAPGNTVRGNLISGNAAAGVSVSNFGVPGSANGNLIVGNRIGLTATGASSLPNGLGGITIDSANNTIGGTTAAARNFISGNIGSGVTINGSSGNTVVGNYVGTDFTGLLARGNTGSGIRVQGAGASNNTIGGTAAGAGNIIAFNTLNGLTLAGTTAAATAVRRNSFFSNGGLAIDAGDDGVTLNTTGNTLNSPVLTSVRAGVGVIEVEGFARPGKTIEFYVSDTLGQGRTYLATAVEGSPADTDATTGSYGPGPVNGRVVGSDTANRFHFTIPVPADFVVGSKVTATSIGSISEFAAAATADVARAFGAPVVDAGPDAVLVVGQTFSGRGSFSDIDSDYWPTAEVNYGDGGGWQALALDPPVYAPRSAEDFTIAATVGFALSHRYVAPGNYTVAVRVTDDSGQTGGDALLIDVENAPPTIDNSRFVVTPQRVAEGGTVTLTGNFADESVVDSHTVRIIWGDGTQSYATVNEANRTFTADHTYLNDNLPNTASDVYPLQAIITDGSGASATTVSGLFFVQVDNVRPTDLTLTTSNTTINEGDTLVLGGSFTDPGVQDTHRVAITWGDGSADTIVNLSAGVTTFAGIPHQYRNNPAAPATNYAVSVRVTDNDEPLSPVTSGAEVAVNNVLPSKVVVTPSLASVFENDTISLSGSFSDPGTLDSHTVVINWGDGSGKSTLQLAAGVTSFAGVPHRYLDNPAGYPAGSFPITVTVADSDQPGSPATGATAVTVRNANPSISFSLSASSISENGVVVASGTYADPGTLDRHTVRINWGDGNVTDASVDSTTRTFNASHQYPDDNPTGTSSDDYTITATVTDNDAATGSASRVLTVNNLAPVVRILPGATNSLSGIQLVSEVTDASPSDTFIYAWTVTPVGGGTPLTGSGSTFTFATAPSTSYTATLTVTDDDGGTTTTAVQVDVLTEGNDVYAPTSNPDADVLMVFGLAGEDVIDGSALSIPLILDGGADIDVLTGGSADDVIVLHQGNDSGYGLGGNDQYLLTPNSTLTVVDGSGNNTLNFGAANFGITLDLTQTSGQLQDVSLDAPNLHYVSVNDLGTGQFGTLVGSSFDDSLTAASNSSLFGGLGRDNFFVNAGTDGATISGGADADQLTTSGTSIGTISFNGDEGADLLTNLGIVSTITFGGGSDGDQLLNSGTISLITFNGDDGVDLLTNTGSIAAINFGGGSDGDQLLNTGIVGQISFNGDDGIDLLTNQGVVSTIIFGGGSDGDQLLNTATGTVTGIVFNGDDGIDLLTNSGSVGTITFGGGSDGDQLLNSGIVGQISFNGDDGADLLTNQGKVASIIFGGGSDGDLLQNTGTVTTTILFTGDDGADMLLNAGSVGTITFGGGSDGDQLLNAGTGIVNLISFNGDDGADILTNIGSVGTITFKGGADGDLLQTATGSVATSILFNGDDGADMLLNFGSTASITFNGGSDGDLLQNSGTNPATVIVFNGDDGADLLLNNGSVGTITFGGGSDGDLLQNTGTVATTILFTGDDGADALLNIGTVGAITFGGGSDGDLLQNTGTVATAIVFNGDDGADILTNAGSVATITFKGGADGDLLQTTTGSTATTIVFNGDDGADILTNFGAVATITFTGGADNDRFRNYANDVNDLTFNGDDGADLLVNTGSNIASIAFNGDDGADILLNAGGGAATTIFFNGDDGADILQNTAAVATITFTGGSDGDQLLNNGVGVSLIDFHGDDGADILTNFGTVTTITFKGGADGDLLQTATGSVATNIVFNGDDGADALTTFGTITNLTFGGGSDGDLLQNAGTVVSTILFQGDDGADILQNIGTVGAITFNGGSDGDLLQNGGTVTTIDFHGDDGADILTNFGTVATITFNGGADGDLLQTATGSVATTIVFNGDDGADTLTSFGTVATITFTGGSDGDLLQTATGSTATTLVFNGDDGADTLLNFGTATTITFNGGSDGDLLQNNGTVASLIDFHGDDGADILVNLGSNVAKITFAGGSDNDTFWNFGTNLGEASFNGDDGADILVNNGTVATTISFIGDDGADTLINNGGVATIVFTGGSDGDLLQNTGTVATTIVFNGDDGADTLTNAGSVASIVFTGGSDGDLLQMTTGSVATTIDFHGDDGADNLLNAGTVGTIIFTGGSDGDLLQNSGGVSTLIDFHGDDGADTLINSGVAAKIVFTAGADDDLYIERGHPDQVTFLGGSGNDRVLFSGSGSATFDGGAGSDEYAFAGAAQGSIAILEDDSPLDTNTFDFSGYTASGVNVDLSRTTTQTVSSGLSLTLNSALGISNIVGTSFGDTLIGNARNNVLTGAALRDDRVTAAPVWDGVTQWVLLDFDTETGDGEHVYTAAERAAIQSRIAADYQGPDPQNPWFHVQFTQSRSDIPALLLNAGQFATLYFNRTPSFNRPGGEASELDFGNANLGGTASIQVNGLTGGANQPTTTSEHIVALAAKIGAHELAHLMGVRHADAFGPIGYGLHSPPGTASFKPSFDGPEGAYETFSHLIGSPATVGSDRFNDLNDLYFGEREAMKLSFSERGTVAAEQSASHGTIATAQPLTLAALTVPTTSQGLNANSTFDVAALAVTGQINLVGGKSESDYYSFAGRKGDLFNIEVISAGLANAGNTIDSVLRLYDASGHLVSYYGGTAVNDDQFEPTDSLLFDVLLPADGTYYIEVDTFARSPNDPAFDPTNASSPLNPANAGSIFNPVNPNYDAARLARFLDTRDDTDTGRYELFLYRFGASNTVDVGDNIQGGDGNDTLMGGMGGDTLVGGSGDDVISLDGGGTALATPLDHSVNEGAAVTVLTTSGTQTVSWHITASNGQTITDGSGSKIAFVANDNGTYMVNFTIFGSGGDQFSDSTVVTVLNVAPTATLSNGGAVNEGSSGALSFSSPSDIAADQSSLRYAFDFDSDGKFEVGDGTYSGGVTATSAAVPASYLSNGPFNRVVTGRIIDKDGGYTDYVTTITVNNVVPVVSAGGNAGLSSPTLARSGNFTDPGADVWTATVNYGDGTGTQPLTLNADKTFTLLHTYLASGTFTVTVTVNDGAAAGTASFQVINNVPAVVEAGPNQTANEGALVSLTGANFTNDYVSGAHTATINWGDGTSVVAGGVSQSASGSGVAGTISGSHRYADNGSYVVTVTVTTPYGAVSSDTFTVTVNNVAPTLAVPSGPTMVIPGQPLTYSSAFTDPGFDNALNTGGEVVEAFTGTVNWGDGTATETATVTWTTGGPGTPSAGSIGKSHIYAATGSYTITFTLNDDDNGTATRTLAVAAADSAYVLASSGSETLSVSGNGRIALPGIIEVNSTSTTAVKESGNARISASQIHVVGGYSLSGNSTISSTPITGGAAAADPLAGLSAPSVSGTTGSVNLSGNSSLTIGPGRYSQIKVSGNASLTLLPGVYVILGGGMSITGNANVNGNGVMIYNAGSNYPTAGGSVGGIAVTGNGTINLTPPAVGTPYAGILFFQSRDNALAMAISGSGLLGVRGTIYAPVAQLAISGNAELKASLVVKSLTVSGNAASTLVVEGDVGVVGLAKSLLSADLWVYVNNAGGAFPVQAFARIDEAIAGLNAVLLSHNVVITRVDSPDDANLVIDAAQDTPLGGAADGVLGFFAETDGRGAITMVQGWDWYQGQDPSGVGQSQFDFQTILTHELGHALGLGHNADASSVMHDDLSGGMAKRTMTEADLNIPDLDDGEGDPLLASGSRTAQAMQAVPDRAAAATYLPPPLDSQSALQSGDAVLTGPKRIAGDAGGDVLLGGEGNDLILQGDGYDCLIGGFGTASDDGADLDSLGGIQID